MLHPAHRHILTSQWQLIEFVQQTLYSTLYSMNMAFHGAYKQFTYLLFLKY